jgi:polyisoprenoid-binding protein YceI
MMIRLTAAAIALSTVALVQPVFGADKYTIDPEHVSVNFTMQHSKWAKYQGTVRSILGDIVFDKEDVATSSVHVVMATDGIDTLNKTRDEELYSSSGGFLSAKEFPRIVFDSTSVQKTGDRTGKILGDLTMAGITHQVSLDVIFDGEGRSPWDGFKRIGFSATGKLDIRDFGLTSLIDLDIGPELDFTIEVEATRL